MKRTALIGFGSNLGEPSHIYENSISALEQLPDVTVVSASKLIQTNPIGGPEQPNYSNGAIRLETELTPLELHHGLLQIENELGRERRVRWGPRSVDLDLLLVDQLEIETAQLIIPHPRMSFRRFVLHPSCEIAAEMLHPGCSMTIEALIAHLDDSPRQIALLVDPTLDDLVQQVVDNLSSEFADWKFHKYSTAEARRVPKAKLTVLVVGSETPPVSAVGPQILLRSPDQHQLMNEVSRAIEATLPLC